MLFVDSVSKPNLAVDYDFINSFDVRYLLLIACLSANVYDDVQMIKNLETLEEAQQGHEANAILKLRRSGVYSKYREESSENDAYLNFRSEVVSNKMRS